MDQCSENYLLELSNDMTDFARYRAASAVTGEIFPLSILDRTSVLDNFTAIESRETTLDQRREIRSRSIVLGPGKHHSSTHPDRLGIISLSPDHNLNNNEPAKGKLLLVRIVSSVIRLASVQFIGEDHQGRVAPIHLHHIPIKYGLLELNETYSRGAIFGTRSRPLAS